MACSGCLEINAQACAGDIKLPAMLVAKVGQNAVVQMTDKFGAVYVQECEIDGDGNIFYSLKGFPDGYFNEFFGALNFKIFEDIQMQCPLTIVQPGCGNEGNKSYDCIKATPTKIILTNTALLEQENTGLLEQENEGGIIIQE